MTTTRAIEVIQERIANLKRMGRGCARMRELNKEFISGLRLAVVALRRIEKP